MAVFFYSMIWRQGKTTHAVGYTRHAGAILITNDIENNTADIYRDVLPEGTIKLLEPGQPLASVLSKYPSERVVIDFGGWVEPRAIDAAKVASVCVVPLFYQSSADLTPAVKTVLALQKHARNIVIVINNTAAIHVPGLTATLEKRFPDVAIFVVNHSRQISRLPDEGQTVFDLFSRGGLDAFALRKVLPQIKALYAHLDACEQKNLYLHT